MTASSDPNDTSCLIFDPKHMDFEQPTLWWCLDALDVYAVGKNAICKASTVSWKEVEESGETLANIVSSFQFVLVCAPPGPDRDEVVEHLTSFLYTPVLVPTEKAFRGCASVGQLKDIGGEKAVDGLLFGATEVPIP